MTSDTYQTILQNARRLFVRQGYTATSMRQIAEETGIGKATIYHHFADKEEILGILLKQQTGPTQRVFEEIRAEKDPRRRVELATFTALKFFYETADLLQLVRREAPKLRKQMMEEYNQFQTMYKMLLQDAIMEGVENGLFRPLDPAKAIRVLMTLIQGTFATTFLSDEKPLPPEEATALILDIYFQGINKAQE